MILSSAFEWSSHLFGFAALLQTAEMLLLRHSCSDHGIWRWDSLKHDYDHQPILRQILTLFLNARSFFILNAFALAASLVLLFPSHMISVGVRSICFGVLLLSTWLTAIRFRGMFHGGSDAMTIVMALSLFCASLSVGHAWVQKICAAYIGVQVTMSYCIAGWVKLRSPAWRTGQALRSFIKTPRYDSPPKWFENLLRSEVTERLLSYAVILFDLTFPFSWLHPKICVGYLIIGFLFHVGNHLIFGLNRFVWIWLTGYPMVYYWST